MVRRKQLEHAVAHRLVLLVDDGVASALDEHLRVDQAGERHDAAVQLQRIGHRQRIGMAGHRQHVLGLEDGRSARGSCGALRVSVRRSVAGSKPSVRPAAWIGWNVTPRTRGCSSAKSMIRPISWSFRPFFSVTTSVVEIPSAFRRCERARCAPRADRRRAARCCGSGSSESNCRYTSKSRHVAGEPLGERPRRARCGCRWCSPSGAGSARPWP